MSKLDAATGWMRFLASMLKTKKISAISVELFTRTIDIKNPKESLTSIQAAIHVLEAASKVDKKRLIRWWPQMEFYWPGQAPDESSPKEELGILIATLPDEAKE